MTRETEINAILAAWKHDPAVHKALSSAVVNTAWTVADDLTGLFKAELSHKTESLKALINAQQELIHLLLAAREH